MLSRRPRRELATGYVGTEALLLGLLRQHGVAAQALQLFDITLERAREEVMQHISSGERPAASSPIPFTPRATSVLETALREALSRGERSVGPEHILLGMARASDGLAMRVLRDLGVDAAKVRATVNRTVPVRRPMRGVAIDRDLPSDPADA